MDARHRLDALLAAGAFGAVGSDLEIIETHVSWVVLTGDLAYKVKKPVKLGFLDFSSLAARRQACEEELRLNRRLAPDLYLDVVELRLATGDPAVTAGEPQVEYAVKMRRFPPGAAVGAALAASMTGEEAAQLGQLLGLFHRALPPAPQAAEWGGVDATWGAIESSLAQLGALLPAAVDRERLAHCRRFLAAEFARRQPFMLERRRCGAVRECHGDLHLGNLVRLGERVVPFDALEFDPALRWIDVINELAFLLMDLDVRGRRDRAFGLLNAYLDVTGDFTGLQGLPLYLSYRALVRAKVGALSPVHAAGSGPGVQALLDYAATPLPGLPRVLVVMCGVSGSGKSWLARQLAVELPAIHVRSDVERKRLFGLAPLARTDAMHGTGIYAPAVSARVYAHMAELAGLVLAAGLPVILDATSLRREHRAALLAAAAAAGLPGVIITCVADDRTLADRVTRRAQAARDPSEADIGVVRRQLHEFEPVRIDEARRCIVLDTTGAVDVAAVVDQVAGCAN